MKNIFKKLHSKEFDNYNEELQELKGISFKDVINGHILTKRIISGQAPFVLYIVFLGFLYINNHYKVEALQKELASLNKEVKNLRYEAVTTSSELMSMSKQSEVLRKVRNSGIELEELSEPPRILYVNK